MSKITRTQNLGVSRWRNPKNATIGPESWLEGGKFWVAQPRHLGQDLRGGSKRTYPGGAPPNTPPYPQWGALIYAGTPGDSRRCQNGTGLPKMSEVQNTLVM